MILANGRITENERPSFPGTWGIQHTNTADNLKLWKVDRPVPLNYRIPMDWHHIIPWKVLRNGWSALATSGRWEVIAAWADMWQLDNVPATVAKMQKGQLSDPPQADMWNKLCWAQWNLVEGPTNGNRAAGDDPGSEALDTFEGFAMSNNLRDRSIMLKAIYTEMKAWKMDTSTITADGAKNLLRLFGKLKTYRRTLIHRFDPTVWEMVTPGRISKFGLAESGQHAKWKKRR